MASKWTQAVLLGIVLAAPGGAALSGQTSAPANAVPHQSGTVKAVAAQSFVLTTAAGQDVTVSVPAGTSVLLVQPGSHDLKSAQPGTVSDIAAGDRAIVNGSSGDAGGAMSASRVIVMKSGAIAATHATEQAAWAGGVGGIVRSVDPSTGVILLSSGMRSWTVNTSTGTSVRRYAGGSVRFEDAVASTLAAVQPGDQIRVRGARAADGTTITADAIVAGSFSNYSGLLASVDATAGTVTLKDLASKRTVTVAVTTASNLRRLPPGAAQAMAGRGAGAGSGAGAAGSTSGARPAPEASGTAAAGGGAGASGRPAGVGRSGGGAGADLSRMMNRLPTETLADLKPGDAVMIVASNGGSGEPTAITLLAGVDQILAAHPTGETTLSPWNIGGGEGEGEGEGGPR